MAQQTDHIGEANKMVTAVYFTINEIHKMYKFHNGQLPIYYVLELLDHAKTMEKEQIIKTYNNAISKMDYFIQPESAEQYYNETYNK